MSANPQQAMPTLADKLRDVQLGLREDLEVTRHLFRGKPCYIIRDPITFLTQRLEPADYDVFVRIEASRSLGSIFSGLVEEGKADADAEESFYQFIMSLHRIGFLHLPVVDDRTLYRRHQVKLRAARKAKLFGFLFLKIPLINPSAFLDRTIGRVEWVFSKTFFVIWVVVMLAAGSIAVRRWHDLSEPLQGLLVVGNLPLMWATLVGLKVFHEFGHAYCCRHYGGHVPEMGAFLILFTPCAYMDATSSWGFRRKRHRVYVCLAGMYFESMIAALALLVWSLSAPGLLHSAAYNVIFLATVVTVAFNANPLMRYDGYYILSDLVEIPNLRARAAAHVAAVAKRIIFGIEPKNEPADRRMRVTLLLFGVAASLYRILLVLGISAVLASKVFLVGILLAGVYVGSTAYGMISKLVRYLWHAEETSHLRLRGVLIGVLALLLLPAATFLVPLPSSVKARCVVMAESEMIAHAREPGFLQRLSIRCDQEIERGSVIAELANDDYTEQVATAQAGLRASQILMDAYRVYDPTLLKKTEAELRMHRDALTLAQARQHDMVLRAPCSGHIVDGMTPRDLGRFISTGEPIATIVSGKWQVHAMLNEEEVADVEPRIGDVVAFRPVADPATTLLGTISRVAPAGSRKIHLTALTHLGGGDVAIDPRDHKAAEPYFEVTIDLAPSDAASLRYGMIGKIQLSAKAMPIGVKLTRRVATFVNKLLKD
ncbi:MAG: HlyD family efflux transporter periplasmic adaptor subunit [Phycisphaerae bacterium]